MSTNIDANESKPVRQSRWYVPTPAKYLVFVLLVQGGLFLSAYYRWFAFNERKGFTVLFTVATTGALLLLLGAWVLIGWFFKAKTQFGLLTLLLIVPVMAIPCGWLAREIAQARQQGEIVAAINAKGGSVAYGDA